MKASVVGMCKWLLMIGLNLVFQMLLVLCSCVPVGVVLGLLVLGRLVLLRLVVCRWVKLHQLLLRSCLGERVLRLVVVVLRRGTVVPIVCVGVGMMMKLVKYAVVLVDFGVMVRVGRCVVLRVVRGWWLVVGFVVVVGYT